MVRKQTRMLVTARRQGTVTSASIATDAVSGDFDVIVDIDAIDAANPLNEIGIALQGTFDGGQTWENLVVSRWRGGVIGRDGLPIRPRIGYSGRAAERVRVELDVPLPQRIGCDLSEGAVGEPTVR
jgi:hypothetical protein